MKMKLYSRQIEQSCGHLLDHVSLGGYNENGKEMDIKISGPQLFPANIDLGKIFEMELIIKYIPEPEPIILSIK